MYKFVFVILDNRNCVKFSCFVQFCLTKSVDPNNKISRAVEFLFQVEGSLMQPSSSQCFLEIFCFQFFQGFLMDSHSTLIVYSKWVDLPSKGGKPENFQKIMKERWQTHYSWLLNFFFVFVVTNIFKFLQNLR